MIIKKINATEKRNETSPELVLFFAGWGMDEHPFLEYLPADRDCLICYDYSSLSFDESLLSSYKRIRVVAWSMGVWAASQILSCRDLPVTESIAINGTPWPVDDERGIATTIFRGTLEGVNEKKLQKFRRRMCGSKEVLEHFMQHAPRRTIEDLYEELKQIGKQSTEQSGRRMENPAVATGIHLPHTRNSVFEWDKIYIGLQDKIFLPDNQQKAWERKKTIMIDCEHYPYALWQRLLHTKDIKPFS